MESKASREGRWQEFAAEALEECGYAYFLTAEEIPADEQRGEDGADNGRDDATNPGNPDDDSHPMSHDGGAECRINASALGADLNRPSRITSLVSITRD